jgi:hypothetical protein
MVWLILVSAIVGLAGCARPTSSTVFHVGVSSYGHANNAPGASFAIVPGDNTVRSDDPEFLGYAAYLEGVLIDQGFKPATVDTADIEITLKYGIGEGDTKLVGANSGGYAYAWSNRLSTFRSDTTYTYDTVYARTIQVVAYDLAVHRLTNQWKLLWKTQMVSQGHSADLRVVFPYMLAAGEGYLGIDSGETVYMTLNQNDQSVQKIRDDSKSLP